MMAENVRAQVHGSAYRLLIIIDKLVLKKSMSDTLKFYRMESTCLLDRNVKLWRSARRQIFKEYNEKKKELRREKKKI